MSSREKGKRGERECAAELERILGVPMRRGVQYRGGADSPDVVGWPGVHIEAKRTETLSVYKAMDQAAKDSDGNIPVVWHRRNHRESLLIIRAKDMIEFAAFVICTVDTCRKGRGETEKIREVSDGEADTSEA